MRHNGCLTVLRCRDALLRYVHVSHDLLGVDVGIALGLHVIPVHRRE